MTFIRINILTLSAIEKQLKIAPPWKSVRVADGARLESVCTFIRTEGSNPSFSAIIYRQPTDSQWVSYFWNLQNRQVNRQLQLLLLLSINTSTKPINNN